MGTAVRPAKTSPGPWDAFADVDAFVDEVLIELEAMAKDGSRPTRSGPKPPLTGAALRKAIMAIWCVCFCGMPWRAIGQLCEIPFGTLYGLFARWTRLGLWRRLLDQLRRRWRLACGDASEPSAVVIDSRSCRSAPSCCERGLDGGKKIRGVKIHVAVDNYGIPLAIEVSPANRHDGTVRLTACQGGRGRVAELDDDTALSQLCRPPLPSRDHQLRGLALFPLSSELAACGRDPRRARHHGQS